MAGGNSGSRSNSGTEGSKFLDSMNYEKQNRHIPGTKEYDSSKSDFSISSEELDKLIRENIDNADNNMKNIIE